MEDTKGEKEKSVDERADENSSDEWTIINDEKEKSVSPADEHSESNDDNEENEAVIEQAREVIEEIDASTLDNSSAQPHEEESDGISVISECGRGEADVSGPLAKFVEPVGKLIPRTGGYTDFVAVCCLAAAIAFGIGWAVGIGCAVGNFNAPFSTSDIEVVPEKSVNPKAKLRTDVFEEAAVTIEKAFASSGAINIIAQDSEEFGVSDKPSKLAPKENLLMQKLNIQNFEKIPTFKDSFEKVQLSLTTLCSLIENNQKFGDKNHICKNPLALADVIELKDTVEFMVNELGYREEAAAKKLIQNVDSKIENLAQGFLDELTRILENYVMKVDQKLLKIGGKLHQKICLIRNTYANNAKIQEILEKRRISLKSCDSKKNENSDNREEKKRNRGNSVNPDEVIDLKNKRKNEKSQEFKGKKTKSFQESENSNERIYDKNDFKSKKIYKSKNPNENSDEYKQKRKYGSKENYVEQKRENHYKDFDDKENENVCYSKKCGKPHDKEEKHKGNGKNGDWQFERAQGRNRYRSDEEGIYGVWYDNRARARERARLLY